MKLLKKLFGIKTTYAIPSDNGVDITKGKKYKFKRLDDRSGYIKDDVGVEIYIIFDKDGHTHSNWTIITE